MSARIYRGDEKDREIESHERLFDPYAHLNDNPNARDFIMRMDLHTLEEVIVRVMSNLWRRRQKYLGGDVAMAARGKSENSEGR
jgi:hypothetical protein